MYSKSTYGGVENFFGDGRVYSVPEAYSGVAFDGGFGLSFPNSAAEPTPVPTESAEIMENNKNAVTEADAAEEIKKGISPPAKSRWGIDLSGDDILIAIVILLMRDGREHGGNSDDGLIMLLAFLMVFR